jgi:hypothetical protein
MDTQKKYLNNDDFKVIRYHRIKDKGYLIDDNYIYPFYLETDKFQLYPYEYVNDDIKIQVINGLNNEIKCKDVYTNEYISSNWSGSNIFYVLTSSDNKHLYGTIAIKFNNMDYPFISDLFTVRKYRSNGYARYLLKYANKYIKKLGYSKSILWCNDYMLKYYINLGWKIQNKTEDYYVMEYNL